MCILFVYTLIKVVSYYDLSVLSVLNSQTVLRNYVTLYALAR